MRTPVDIVAAMTIGETGIDVDLTGTSAVSDYGINVPLPYTQAYATFGVRCVVGSTVPNNAGSLAPVRVSAPEGSILNAKHPRAVAARHTIGQMLPDVMLGCLSQAVDGIGPAEGTSCLWNFVLYGGDGIAGGGRAHANATPFTVTLFHNGGTGARPTKGRAIRDGISVGRAQHAGGNQRGDFANPGAAQGISRRLGRRRAMARWFGSSNGNRQRRGRALCLIFHVRPRAQCAARTRRRRRWRERARVARVRRGIEPHGAAKPSRRATPWCSTCRAAAATGRPRRARRIKSRRMCVTVWSAGKGPRATMPWCWPMTARWIKRGRHGCAINNTGWFRAARR